MNFGTPGAKQKTYQRFFGTIFGGNLSIFADLADGSPLARAGFKHARSVN